MLGKESRKFVRIDAHHLVRYRALSEAETKKKELSFARNVSAGGVLFCSKEAFPEGSSVELELNFPSYPEPIRIVVRVVRVHPLKAAGEFEVAAEFAEISEQEKEFINQKILRATSRTQGGGRVKNLATVFLVLGIIAGLTALVLKLVGGVAVPVKPATWVLITNTCLLFSIAVNLTTLRK